MGSAIMKIRSLPLLACAFVLTASVAWAGGMKIEPGLWEFQMTTQHPMSPTPMTETTTDCIDTPELNPADMPKQSENCTISDMKADDASMSWKISCAQDGGTMTGDFKLVSSGTSVTGSSVMVMKFQDQKFEIKTDWKGRRTGACQ